MKLAWIIATEQHITWASWPPFYAYRRLFPPCVEDLKPAAFTARKMLNPSMEFTPVRRAVTGSEDPVLAGPALMPYLPLAQAARANGFRRYGTPMICPHTAASRWPHAITRIRPVTVSIVPGFAPPHAAGRRATRHSRPSPLMAATRARWPRRAGTPPSPAPTACCRLLRTGQAQVYQRVLPGLPVALADPYSRLDLARAAARAGLALFPSTR